MVEFEDNTLIESDGYFDQVSELMDSPRWMLRSKVYITTEDLTYTYVMNFWYDKRVIIDDVFRSIYTNIGSPDLLEFMNWSEDRGWLKVEPSPRLLDNPRQYDFWKRQYEAGLITCEEFDKREEEITKRLSKLKKEEETEDAD